MCSWFAKAYGQKSPAYHEAYSLELSRQARALWKKKWRAFCKSNFDDNKVILIDFQNTFQKTTFRVSWISKCLKKKQNIKKGVS